MKGVRMSIWESFWDIIWWFFWVFVFVSYLMVLSTSSRTCSETTP